MRTVVAAHQGPGILRLSPVAWAVVFTVAEVELGEGQALHEGDKAARQGLSYKGVRA